MTKRIVDEALAKVRRMKLWAIYIPGPDEYYPAPSEEAANRMAEKHLAAMEDYIAKNNLDWAKESITAEVVEWPLDSNDHANEIAEFDYDSWGIERFSA